MTSDSKKADKKLNKILLIWYWWTIVMVVDWNTVRPADNVDEIFDLVPNIKKYADIDLKILSNVDSTNVVPEDWTKMAEEIIAQRDNYDAFIVAHWTNTMAYSASAVSLALSRWFWKPVIFTGSQLPLTVWWNDWVFNLENAVKLANKAVHEWVNEVMVVFSDRILRASRTLKVSESEFRAFDSPIYPHIWHVKSTWISFIDWFTNRDKDSYDFKPQTKFETWIVSIDLTPWQSPFIIKSVLNNRACNWIILKSHWAWSVPSIGDYSFLPLIKEATFDLNLPVLVSTKFIWWNSFKETNDEPAIEAINNGAIPTWDLTDVMSEVKLMWLLAQWVTSPKDIRREILKDYVWEVTPINIEDYEK